MAKKTRTIGVIVPEDLFVKIRYCASMEMADHSMSGMIMRLLEDYVAGRDIDMDLARELVRTEKRGRGFMSREQRLDIQRKMEWTLPYGVWTCEDGRQFLFNRHYCPIFERASSESPAKTVDAWIWVPKVREAFVWTNDKRGPWCDRGVLLKCQELLHQWGVWTRQDGSVYDMRAKGGPIKEYVFEAF